ncbi:hypothetical protein [Romboutsia sp. 1001713B170131_170501_G6]|uniref:hypothetical protein n=1 Tax=Romboutsia sp. 1001713B170131_170501_G6 TaxID=2787108 RepID=UPI0018A9864E|nr:hypothetical protein [Romboutsia sp. 1001713B170131_170501_G6]
MKKNKLKLFPLLLVALFTFLVTFNSLSMIKSEAYGKDLGEVAYSRTRSSFHSSSSSKSYSKPKTIKPSSGSFSSKPSSNLKSSKSSKSQSTIKPDSGGFTTKPSDNSNIDSKTNNKSNSTIKPDSGSFSTKPKNESNENNSNTNKKYYDYDEPKSSRPIFGGGYYSGGFNPFGRMFYSFSMSSWIVKLVVILTIIVVLYIAIDFIRNRRDRD